jgi:hypothetical protein
MALADDRWQWQPQRQWQCGGSVGCGVGCGVGGSFCGNSGGGGGSKCHDDGGMEEVVTWRLFMFMIFSYQGVYRDSPIGDNFTLIFMSSLARLAKS